MADLGLTIGSFAPALGSPGRASQFNQVATWMDRLRQEHGYWLQGFPLRGCLDTNVSFDSIEGPWCGLTWHNFGGWYFKRERYHSLSHRLQAMVVLRLYDSPANIVWWLHRCSQKAARIINNTAELHEIAADDGEQTWLEIGPTMDVGIHDLISLFENHLFPNGLPNGVVIDTHHLGQLSPSICDHDLAALMPYVRLLHWQPSRASAAKRQSEIERFLRGQQTESVETLLRIRSLPGGDQLPIVLEPSLHHWRQLGGPRCWLSVEWIKARLLQCLEIMQEHLSGPLSI